MTVSALFTGGYVNDPTVASVSLMVVGTPIKASLRSSGMLTAKLVATGGITVTVTDPKVDAVLACESE